MNCCHHKWNQNQLRERSGKSRESSLVEKVDEKLVTHKDDMRNEISVIRGKLTEVKDKINNIATKINQINDKLEKWGVWVIKTFNCPANIL